MIVFYRYAKADPKSQTRMLSTDRDVLEFINPDNRIVSVFDVNASGDVKELQVEFKDGLLQLTPKRQPELEYLKNNHDVLDYVYKLVHTHQIYKVLSVASIDYPTIDPVILDKLLKVLQDSEATQHLNCYLDMIIGGIRNESL